MIHGEEITYFDAMGDFTLGRVHTVYPNHRPAMRAGEGDRATLLYMHDEGVTWTRGHCMDALSINALWVAYALR